MKTVLSCAMLSMLTFVSLDAAELAELKTLDGKVYRDVKVIKVTAAEMRIMHEDGMAAVPLSALPPELLKQYALNPDPKAEADEHARRRQNNMRAYGDAQAAKGERDSGASRKGSEPEEAAVARQKRMAAHYAKSTGQSFEACLQAVRVCDWCATHPQGGTVNNVHYDARATGELMHEALKFLGLVAAAPAAPAGVGAIESNIDGEFTGFEGERVFKLLNGQVWQQADFTFHYHYAYGPRVMIYAAGGGMMMKVDGVEKAVRVMQLR